VIKAKVDCAVSQGFHTTATWPWPRGFGWNKCRSRQAYCDLQDRVCIDCSGTLRFHSEQTATQCCIGLW